MPHRFFVPKEQVNKSTVEILASDADQIRKVLRLTENDDIDVLDGSGKVYAAKIRAIKDGRVICDIVSSRSAKSEPRLSLCLIQSVPRESKMDFIIQKCTELGMHEMVPMVSERTIVKLDDKKKQQRAARWQRIAKEAAEQSGRGVVPKIKDVKAFAKALEEAAGFDMKLIPWEMESETSIKDAFIEESDAKSIAIAIGPEGGFSKDEIRLAMEHGFRPVGLGKRILRTETAGIAVLSMINYEFEM